MLNQISIQPPLVQHASKTVATIFLVVMLVVLAGLVIAAARKRNWLLPVLLVGAGIAGFVEAQLDVLSRIIWASNLPAAYTTYGRRIPLFALPTYALAIGGGIYLTYWLCTRGATRRQVFSLFVALAAVESVFEMITMVTHFWKYYGPQPIDVFGFPLYWGVINGAGMVVTGTLIYGMRSRFAGRNVLAAVLVPPLAFGMDFAVGWPTWDVMNTGASKGVMSLVSLLTIALCVSEVWFVAGLFASDGSVVSVGAAVPDRRIADDLAAVAPARQRHPTASASTAARN